MFKEDYQNAYNHIVPEEHYMETIHQQFTIRKQRQKRTPWLRPAVATAMAVCIIGITMPVMAKNIPTIYNIVDRYARELSQIILPDTAQYTDEDIRVKVEAVNVHNQNAEILLSVSVAQNRIYEKVDLFDNYTLSSNSASSNIGGCRFLEYRADEGKAYFQISVSTDDHFDKSRLTFSLHRLLTRCFSEKHTISLETMISNPNTKEVSLNGCGGIDDKGTFSSFFVSADTEDFNLPNCKVLDLSAYTQNDTSNIEASNPQTQLAVPDNTGLADNLTILGTAYMDGVLRLQVCNGTFDNADRHLQPFLVHQDGTEYHEDYSVGWQEQVDGKTLYFSEHWFCVDKETLDSAQLYGIFHISDGLIKGNWEVHFRLQ